MKSSYRLYSATDLEPGDHLCCLYETEEEHRALLTPFMRQGLERGDQVLYVVDARTAEIVQGYLRAGGLDVESYLARGQLQILSQDQTYLRHGVFDPQAMISLLRAALQEALAQGYPALRVTGEMTWALRELPGTDRLIEYERLLNDFLPGSRCLALCQYDCRRFDPDILLEVVRSHPVVVVGTEFYDNFYYLPPQEWGREQAGYDSLRHWLSNLEARKRTEEALLREVEISAAMTELSRALISHTAVDDISFLVLQHAKQLTGSAYGYVGYINPETGYLVSSTMTRDIWYQCNVPDKNIVFEQFRGLWGWVLDNRQPLLTNTPASDPRSQGIPAGHLPIERFLSAPALVEGKLVGQVALANAAHDYTEQDLELVQRLASFYALALQRRWAETELEAANHRLSSILDSISDGFFTLDDNLVVTYFNPAAEQLLGVPAEQVVGQKLFDVFHEAQGSIFQEKYTWAVREKESVFFETFFGVGPYENWYDVRVYPYESGIAVYFRVTTERKLSEESLARHARDLARSNEELRQFAYIASHDLQEPLRMVSSYLQLLARRYQGRLDADADEFIAFAVDGANRMQKLILALLQYSQVDRAGRPFEPTDMNVVLKRVLSDLYVHIQEAGGQVTSDPLPTVLGDATQLGQVFQNLVGNALKFRDQRPPRVHISACLEPAPSLEGEGARWIFSVQDNGIGIEVEHAGRIFEIFQRLHSRADYPGTGIGLAMCKKIVERHQGQIWFESRPGEGATFYFTLPADASVTGGGS